MVEEWLSNKSGCGREEELYQKKTNQRRNRHKFTQPHFSFEVRVKVK